MNDPLPTSSPLNSASSRVPLGRGACWFIGLICVLGAASLAAFALVPRDTTTRDADGNLTQVSILRPDLVEMLPWVLLAGFVLLLMASIVLLVRKRVLGSLFLLATFFVSFLSMVRGIAGSLGPWTIYDQISAADGSHYCFIDSSFLQGQTMAIARMKSTGRFYRTLEVYGTTNGDSPRSYLLVVRPTPPKLLAYGALYLTSDNRLLVGLRYNNACYMVYDISNKQFYGNGDVEKLSPFLLIDDKSQLHAPDEASILKAIGGANSMGLPAREVLTQALTHDNPAVRLSADNLLMAMKP